MDDLTQCLYEFLLDRRMEGLREDAAYKACSEAVKLQEERVASGLNGAQRRELELLLDRAAEQGSMPRPLFAAAPHCLQKESQKQRHPCGSPKASAPAIQHAQQKGQRQAAACTVNHQIPPLSRLSLLPPLP